MKIETANFGQVEIEKEKILAFREGLPGFPEEKEFIVILNHDKDNPFHWLQSVKTPDLSFVIVNPFEIFSDYDLILPQTAIKKLEIEDEKDIIIYTIVVIPEDIKKMTTNLLGPLVVNAKKKIAKQVILEEEKYSTKHFIFDQDLEKAGV